ncbi:ElaB/YqjD/DUF883 family membrane-anchored ribosome-binding protein [Sphingobium sp. B2D3A]|uniref:hypothetical protein n=1 Tax=unclassified Sphingobium TaxID=2611147 RepID=UPI002224739C|nr:MULTISPECIES: hypothetical protein [unclassified Sphingobium]MCW2338375.1 ElaB/YqjD/DUF883 family membrane-anchored ribosome-binding protein [Sphingobium sp. B2D3A]MCW2350154.1 ElaB/YqjD/DUF883 family membrane-anchored ribosome-binding protein [Sphingobium sp. B12D2B]MCW2384833.1 ElaB/YqjD/DUF883 family membrane-anchored ribosome-binding protein [Sphingobium sp. B2D3D]MCW2394297.1 ElaB/YqjD/DUF883 family membrane-anchored ribosome-binding protein [Sphingobium sp. B8D3B]MCW2417811.1 ElaB/Yqj
MSSAPSPLELAEARQRADGARERFRSALDGVRERLSPAHLKDDAVEAVQQKVSQAKQAARGTLRRHPVLTTLGATGAVGLLFWRPVRFILLYVMRGAWLVWLNRALWSQKEDS